MTGRVQGKVALITGGGRGQGRSHALKLAAEGADIVAFEICHDLKSVAYELASPDDLRQTVAEVEELDRRAIGIQGDVRDLNALTDAVSQAIGTFGKLDIVCANAGIASFVPGLGMEGWAEVAGTNLVGVMNTLHAALPAMTAGGSVIVTGSFAALMKGGVGGEPGGLAYSYAKRQLIEYVKWIGAAAALSGIRVNGIHPTKLQHPAAAQRRHLRPVSAGPGEPVPRRCAARIRLAAAAAGRAVHRAGGHQQRGAVPRLRGVPVRHWRVPQRRRWRPPQAP